MNEQIREAYLVGNENIWIPSLCIEGNFHHSQDADQHVRKKKNVREG